MKSASCMPKTRCGRSPNVVLTAHMAGVTVESSARMAQATVQNVLDVFDGKPDPNNVVNKEVLKGR